MPGKLHGRIIEGITIDFWSTLGWDNPEVGSSPARRALRKNIVLDWLTAHGVTDGAERFDEGFKEYWEIWNDGWKNRRVTYDARHLADWIAKRHNLPEGVDGADDLAKALDETLIAHPPQPVEGAVEAVKELSKHFELALISDTAISGPSSIDAVLESWGLTEHIPVRIYSADVGVSKPHRGPFLTAVQKMEVPQHRIVHIGDLENTDILGAKSLGIAAIRFDGVKTEQECKTCSMADRTVTSWKEVVETLLSDQLEENPSLQVNLS